MNLEENDSLNETVYGTHEDSHLVMSDKVQSLAGSIYQEFERMISRYDEDVVKTLMPLLVNVLECLDAAYQQNQDHAVELELLREDNEQLVTQYEREKSIRRQAEQKQLEYEDAAEGERKEMISRTEALESIVRMLELKHKNSMEHVGRLEERENELKKEYGKLHERYTELFKTHVDYMERTKLLHSGQQLVNDRAEASRLNRIHVGRSSGPISFGFASLENAENVDSIPSSPVSSIHSSPSEMESINIREKLNNVDKSQETDVLSLENKDVATSPISPTQHSNNNSRVQTKKEQRSGNTLYQELSFQDLDGDDETTDTTGGWVHPGEYASSGMGKEVENLIMENNELLATKNALNVVKDDLIVKVDELTGEIDMLREEILLVNVSKTKFRERITELEEEIKKLKEAADSKHDVEEDADVPMAQRKRFTRIEMARVIMERNQYKERFMELQEAVRWTEMLRASKSDAPFDKNTKSIWQFFSSLFHSDKGRTMVDSHLNQIVSNAKPLPMGVNQDLLDSETGSERYALRRANIRKDQYRHVKAHVQKDDGRLHAYGWSLPRRATVNKQGAKSLNKGVLPVPVPIYCRPLAESKPKMKIWCAAGVNSQGGYTKDGGLMVGGSVFYSENPTDDEDYTKHSTPELKSKLSSMVWICSWSSPHTIVTLLDANNPGEIISSFTIASNRIVCIASIPGASRNDYFNETTTIESSEKKDSTAQEVNETSTMFEEDVKFGKVELVEAHIMPTSKKETKVDTDPLDKDAAANVNNLDKPEETASQTEKSTRQESSVSNHEVMSTILPTMWLGMDNGMLHIYSSVANWPKCLQTIKMPDCITSIVHINGKVIVALACGMLAIFYRTADGEWNFSHYYLLTLGIKSQPVREVIVVGSKVWCGYKNKIHILDPEEKKIVHTMESHPRHSCSIKAMAWCNDGVWVAMRLDSTLRLFHAHTYQPLQDVDIEPYIGKMLGTGKLGFSFVRISTLLISSNRMWIGTSNGVIISVPLADAENVESRNSIPLCTMAHAQLSFHGHKDSVKFFIAVPGEVSNVSSSPDEISSPTSSMGGSFKQSSTMLVMSGGDGYVDFRIEDDNEPKDAASHLLVWHLLNIPGNPVEL